MKPSPELYRRVRAVFVEHDSSLAEWCKAKQIPLTSARAALTGDSRSRRAELLVSRLLYVTGLAEDPQTERNEA